MVAAMTTTAPAPSAHSSTDRPRAAGRALLPPQLLGQLARFGAVGAASTLAYLALVWMLRGVVGIQAANLGALLLTAVGNTAANRRLTFAVTGGEGVWRHHAQGLAAFALALALTSGSLVALHAVVEVPPAGVEMVVLVVANVVATLLRFALLRAAFVGRARQ